MEILTAANETLHELLWRRAYDMAIVKAASINMERALTAFKEQVGHIHVDGGEEGEGYYKLKA